MALIIFSSALNFSSLIWQNYSKTAGSRVSVAERLPCYYPCQLQASSGLHKSPKLTISSLPSTSIQVPAVVSWRTLSYRDSLAHVLSLIQDSCNIGTVNSQMGPHNTPGCVHSLTRMSLLSSIISTLITGAGKTLH